MMSIKTFQVTFDGAEPGRPARFWCEGVGLCRTAATGAVCHVR